MPRLATRIETVRGRHVLVPVYRQGVEVLQNIRTRGVIQATVLRYTRSAARENWYWGFVTHVANGLGISKDMLHADLRFKAEYVKGWLLAANGPVPILGSTKREEMDDAEHRAYVDLAVSIVFEHYLPNVRRKDVLAEVERMVGPRPT